MFIIFFMNQASRLAVLEGLKVTVLTGPVPFAQMSSIGIRESDLQGLKNRGRIILISS